MKIENMEDLKQFFEEYFKGSYNHLIHPLTLKAIKNKNYYFNSSDCSQKISKSNYLCYMEIVNKNDILEISPYGIILKEDEDDESAEYYKIIEQDENDFLIIGRN